MRRPAAAAATTGAGMREGPYAGGAAGSSTTTGAGASGSATRAGSTGTSAEAPTSPPERVI